MLIALDYDGTYTADPELWLAFVRTAHASGHRVICATMRTPSEVADMDPRLLASVEVVCTHRQAKVTALRDRGVAPDVWIDDSPHWLLNDAAG